ncbi:hypothetical protein [Desulfobacter vibrioformis]|uniref:hypothetical protein n=1 Tax=Desulfobacter vibrioformis TaxID=34031 RepID=UPI0005513250|nr:hypothetical protein [Desulfobacter vibrioformis]
MRNSDNDWLASRQMEIPGVISAVQPDQPQPLAVFNDRLYTVILDSHSLILAWTLDGEAWVDAYANLENIHTDCSPGLAVFDDKLYCAWNAGPEQGIGYAVYDGETWGLSQKIPNTENWNNDQSPSLAADKNSLYCACLEPGKEQHIHLLWTNDGKKWIEKEEAVLTGIGTKLAPSIACFNNDVYCAWNGYHNESVFYSLFDGKIWSNQSKLEGLETDGRAYPPVLQNINQKLYCARARSNLSINQVGIVILHSGETWQTQPKLNLSHEISGLALAGLKKRLICTWVDTKSKTTNLSFTFSDKLHFPETISYPTSEFQDKSVGPCMVSFDELLYCAWAEKGGKLSSIQLIYSSDGLTWEKADALNSVNITGVPSLAVYNGELCCAWNDTNGISFSTFSKKTWSSPQNIKTQKKIIRNQSPVLVVYESKLFCIWTNSDSRISFASRREDTEWKYYDLLDIKSVKTSLQPSAAVFGNLLYLIWNQENTSINASYFSLPNHVSTVQQITGSQVFDQNNSCLRSEPPVLICTNNRMYCSYKVEINEKPYLNILCSLNGLEWETACCIPLLKETASTQNNTTMAFRGAPSMTSFQDKLYCAWNSYEESSIIFSSATISEPWSVKYISTSEPGGLQVNDFVDFSENSTPGNVGVCLSGGGSRAAIAAMGEIRGLKYLSKRLINHTLASTVRYAI